MKKCYLAGPISGLSYDDCTDWREAARSLFEQYGIEALSPMRGKEALNVLKGPLSATAEEYAHLTPLATPKAILRRDCWDATRCDLLFVNLLGASTVSIGTVMELGFAFAHNVPIVCAIEDKGNVHEHAMVDQAIMYRFPSFAQAMAGAVTALNGRLQPTKSRF